MLSTGGGCAAFRECGATTVVPQKARSECQHQCLRGGCTLDVAAETYKSLLFRARIRYWSVPPKKAGIEHRHPRDSSIYNVRAVGSVISTRTHDGHCAGKSAHQCALCLKEERKAKGNLSYMPMHRM